MTITFSSSVPSSYSPPLSLDSFRFQSQTVSEALVMAFSWTATHQSHCSKALPVPVFVPASQGLLVKYPRSISKMIRQPVVRNMYRSLLQIDEAVLGSSVDVVRYNSTLILSAKRKFENGDMVSFVCPTFFNGIAWAVLEIGGDRCCRRRLDQRHRSSDMGYDNPSWSWRRTSVYLRYPIHRTSHLPPLPGS